MSRGFREDSLRSSHKMFKLAYFVTVASVTLGGSTQFYSYGIVNPEQELISEWINATYLERTGNPLNQTDLNLIWR